MSKSKTLGILSEAEEKILFRGEKKPADSDVAFLRFKIAAGGAFIAFSLGADVAMLGGLLNLGWPNITLSQIAIVAGIFTVCEGTAEMIEELLKP